MSIPIGDRRRAELVLEDRRLAKELHEREVEDFPPVGDRIQQARLQAGFSADEIACRIGLTSDSYRDLESYNFEAFTNLSIKELTELCGILGVQPRVLLLGPEGEGSKQTVTFKNVAAQIAKKISETGWTTDRLAELVGWDVTPIIADPMSLSGYTVEALYDICKVVGCDWVAAIPDARKP